MESVFFIPLPWIHLFTTLALDLTYVQPNDTFYPANMEYKVKTIPLLVSMIFTGIAFVSFLWISVSYHITRLSKLPVFRLEFLTVLTFLNVACAIISIATFAIGHIPQKDLDRYSAIDNFYQQAPCGTERIVKPGVLMMGKKGKAWSVSIFTHHEA